MNKFEELRIKYPTFIYDSYKIEYIDNDIIITFNFIIPGLTNFNPTIKFDRSYILNKNINESYFNYLVFHIGLVELISYVKCTCSPNIIIKAGYINQEQINFFKKLYYNGLGEFLYKNNINITEHELFNIIVEADEEIIPSIEYNGIGNLIPIGGGKDSNVSLELMKNEYDMNSVFIINPKQVHIKCANEAYYDDKKSVYIYRTLDKKIIELNSKGFLNGHTPFSSLVAFISYFIAYIQNKKYIILSNEGSANEPTVLGTNINHQYSKTYEFENDFNNYTNKYFKISIKYFSLLRCLNEFQIALLFSKYKKYHQIFKSCNLGSKKDPWEWCCSCPKCLFAYIILSPFLYKDELIDIFKEDLYERKDLLPIFLELLGYSKTKPFECVGTYEEVRYAVSILISKLDELPYLLRYYKEHFNLSLDKRYEESLNLENNLDPKFIEIVKEELSKYVQINNR